MNLFIKRNIIKNTNVPVHLLVSRRPYGQQMQEMTTSCHKSNINPSKARVGQKFRDDGPNSDPNKRSGNGFIPHILLQTLEPTPNRRK